MEVRKKCKVGLRLANEFTGVKKIPRAKEFEKNEITDVRKNCDRGPAPSK